jgi:hypothetical protein
VGVALPAAGSSVTMIARLLPSTANVPPEMAGPVVPAKIV